MSPVKPMKKLLNISFIAALLATSFAGCMRMTEPEENSSLSRTTLIPYITKVGNQVDLFVMDINGKDKVRLTNDAFEESDPSVYSYFAMVIDSYTQ